MIYHAVPQRSPEWFALRLGMITSSEFHKILTPKTRQLSSQSGDVMCRLIAEQITGMRCHEVDGIGDTEIDDMTRGVELEDAALKAFEMLTDIETSPGGFITDDTGTMGCSPDRLIGDTGGLELKCRLIQTQVKQAIQGTAADEARVQVQGCLMISEREHWYVFNYHPLLLIPPIKTYRDESFIKDLRTVLTSFNEIMLEKRLDLEREYGPFVRAEPADEPPADGFGVSLEDAEMILEAQRKGL